MKNPFEDLGRRERVSVAAQDFEVVTGAFTCDDCWATVGEAKYFDAESLLTWKCPEGHINTLRDFIL